MSTDNPQPRRPCRKTTIALLAATAALALGVQALFPASGAAVINQGSGCSSADIGCFDPGSGGPSIGQPGETIRIEETLSVLDQLARSGHCPLGQCTPRRLGIESSPPGPTGKKGGAPAKPKAPAKPAEQPKSGPKKPPAKPESWQERMKECRAIAKGLVANDFVGTPLAWQEIVEKGWDKTDPENAYVKKVKEMYDEIVRLDAEWHAPHSCEDLFLGRPPV